jgi:hypothetical protein
MGGIPVASPTFAAISAVAPASPGSEVCKQRRYPVATMPFRQSSEAWHFAQAPRGTIAKIQN